MRLLLVVLFLGIVPFVASLTHTAHTVRRLDVKNHVKTKEVCKVLNAAYAAKPVDNKNKLNTVCQQTYPKEYDKKKCLGLLQAWWDEQRGHNGVVNCNTLKNIAAVHREHDLLIKKEQRGDLGELVPEQVSQYFLDDFDCKASVKTANAFLDDVFPLLMELNNGIPAYEKVLRGKMSYPTWAVWGNMISSPDKCLSSALDGVDMCTQDLVFPAVSMLYHFFKLDTVLTTDKQKKAWFKAFGQSLLDELRHVNYDLSPSVRCGFSATDTCENTLKYLIDERLTDRTYLDGNEFFYYYGPISKSPNARFLITAKSDKRVQMFVCLMQHVSRNPYAYFKMSPFHAPQEGDDMGMIDNFVVYFQQEHSGHVLSEIKECTKDKSWIDTDHKLGYLNEVSDAVYFSNSGSDSMAIAISKMVGKTLLKACVPPPSNPPQAKDNDKDKGKDKGKDKDDKAKPDNGKTKANNGKTKAKDKDDKDDKGKEKEEKPKVQNTSTNKKFKCTLAEFKKAFFDDVLATTFVRPQNQPFRKDCPALTKRGDDDV